MYAPRDHTLQAARATDERLCAIRACIGERERCAISGDRCKGCAPLSAAASSRWLAPSCTLVEHASEGVSPGVAVEHGLQRSGA